MRRFFKVFVFCLSCFFFSGVVVADTAKNGSSCGNLVSAMLSNFKNSLGLPFQYCRVGDWKKGHYQWEKNAVCYWGWPTDEKKHWDYEVGYCYVDRTYDSDETSPNIDVTGGFPTCSGVDCDAAVGCGDSSPFSVTFKRGESPDSQICSDYCSAKMGDLELCTGDTCNAQFSYTGEACIPSTSDNEDPENPDDSGSGSDDGSDSGSDTDTGDDGSSGSGDGSSSGGTTGGTTGGTSGGKDSGSGIDTAGIIGAINDQTAVLDGSIQNVADKTQAIDTAIYNEIVPKLEHLASVDSGINSVNDKLQILIDSASTAEEVRTAERMLLENISEWNEQTLGATQDVLKELREVSCGLDPSCLDNGDAGGGDTDGDGSSDGDGNGDGDGHDTGGDDNGECDPETEDCGDGDTNGTGAQYSCTEQAQNFQCKGDPIQCEQLRMQFEQACVKDDLDKLEKKINKMTDFKMEDVILQQNEVSLKNIVANSEFSVAMSGSCPAPTTVPFFGVAISFTYEFICQLASYLRPVFLLMCSIFSMVLVGRTVVGS